MTTENLTLNKIGDALSSLEQNVSKMQDDLKAGECDPYSARSLAKSNMNNLNQIITDYNHFLNEIEETRIRMKRFEIKISASGDAINDIFTHIDNA